jgi:hypothetical protein
LLQGPASLLLEGLIAHDPVGFSPPRPDRVIAYISEVKLEVDQQRYRSAFKPDKNTVIIARRGGRRASAFDEETIVVRTSDGEAASLDGGAEAVNASTRPRACRPLVALNFLDASYNTV